MRLKAYSQKIDGVSIEDFKVPQEEIDAAIVSPYPDDLRSLIGARQTQSLCRE